MLHIYHKWSSARIILKAKTLWNHTLELYEREFIHNSTAAREREIRSIAATSTHVEQQISSIASKFENRINQTAETTLHKNEVSSQPWSVIRFRNPAVGVKLSAVDWI